MPEERPKVLRVLVDLYEATGAPEQAAAYRHELLRATLPPPPDILAPAAP